MTTFIPSAAAIPGKTITSIGYIRQNPGERTNDILTNVLVSKKVNIPYAHGRETVEEYHRTGKFGSKYGEIAGSFEVGSIVLIPNGNQGLLVRLTSGIKEGDLDHMRVVTRSTEHPGPHSTVSCKDCASNIVTFIPSSNLIRIQKHIKMGHTIRPFYSLQRDCEIVGKVDFNGVHGLTFANRVSAGRGEHSWIAI